MKESNQVEFQSQNATLRGRLLLPSKSDTKVPLVIMAHGFSTVIEGMTADKYAAEFQKAGCAVLLYDHRNLGSSDGEPRQEINYYVQARGYIDCIDFVFTLPGIDYSKIALWGCSSSAREAFMVGSVDSRVSAIITQIPAFGDVLPATDEDDGSYAIVKRILSLENIKDFPHTTTDLMPVVSSDQTNNPSAVTPITAFHWFTEYGGKEGTGWKNLATISRPDLPDPFHVGHCAPYLKAPILLVVAHDDEVVGATPEVVYHTFKRITQPKELVEIDGGHFGLLHYPSPIFDKAAKAEIDFLKRTFDFD